MDNLEVDKPARPVKLLGSLVLDSALPGVHVQIFGPVSSMTATEAEAVFIRPGVPQGDVMSQSLY